MKEFLPLVIAGALAWLLYSRNSETVAAAGPAVLPGPGTNLVIPAAGSSLGTNPVKIAPTPMPVIDLPSGGGAMPACPPGRMCAIKPVIMGGGPCVVNEKGVMMCPM